MPKFIHGEKLQSTRDEGCIVKFLGMNQDRRSFKGQCLTHEAFHWSDEWDASAFVPVNNRLLKFADEACALRRSVPNDVRVSYDPNTGTTENNEPAPHQFVKGDILQHIITGKTVLYQRTSILNTFVGEKIDGHGILSSKLELFNFEDFKLLEKATPLADELTRKNLVVIRETLTPAKMQCHLTKAEVAYIVQCHLHSIYAPQQGGFNVKITEDGATYEC